jgi:putative copper export protein
MAIVDVLLRFIHIVSAVVSVGGAVFLLVALPAGLRLVDESRRDEVLLKVRRAFKMTVHPAILGLIVSGIYNTMKLWPPKEEMSVVAPRWHPFWGPHVVLGAVVMGISIWLLAGKTLRTNHRRWLRVNVALMMLVILAGSTARWARLDIVKDKLEAAKADRARLAQLEAATRPAVTP